MTDVSPQFAKLIVTLASAFQNAKLSEAQVRIYSAALSDIPHDQLASACLRAVRECTFFPTVAELRRFIAPSLDDAAQLAWSGLQTAAAEIGAYASLELEDPCAAEAVLMIWGSWPAYCVCDGPAVGARKSEYLAAYRAARRGVWHEGASTTLPGLCTSLGTPASALPEAITWRGRLTAHGTVVAERERRQLEERPINRLIAGNVHAVNPRSDEVQIGQPETKP